MDLLPNLSSALDVGPGFGKYGLLLREHLEVRKRREYDRSKWRSRIDCVEIWEPYITPIHRYVYNEVFVGDIRELVDKKKLGRYELVILADVIEHMPKIDGIKLLRQIYDDICESAMVVSYPPVIGREGTYWNNPHEQHQCLWAPKDFESYKNVDFKGPQVVYIFK